MGKIGEVTKNYGRVKRNGKRAIFDPHRVFLEELNLMCLLNKQSAVMKSLCAACTLISI